jgi:hypothetical protein
LIINSASGLFGADGRDPRGRGLALVVLAARLTSAQAPSPPPAGLQLLLRKLHPPPSPTTGSVRATLEITVFGNADLSRSSTVQPAGPSTCRSWAKSRWRGLTPAEIQRKVTILLERDYLVNRRSRYASPISRASSRLWWGGEDAGAEAAPRPNPAHRRIVEAGSFTARASGEIDHPADGTFEGGRRSGSG